MESSHQEDRSNFIRPWGDLKFSPTPGGLSQMRGLKFSTLSGGGDNRVFPTGGMEGVPPQLAEN